jgi:hypothetical protein
LAREWYSTHVTHTSEKRHRDFEKATGVAVSHGSSEAQLARAPSCLIISESAQNRNLQIKCQNARMPNRQESLNHDLFVPPKHSFVCTPAALHPELSNNDNLSSVDSVQSPETRLEQHTSRTPQLDLESGVWTVQTRGYQVTYR